MISGHEQENRILLNRFYVWCSWAGMHIRVDKCITFGIRKHSTRSIQFQPKLLIDGDLVPSVKTGDSFRYLGRYFDFHMSKLLRNLNCVTYLLPSSLKSIFFHFIRKAKLPFITGIYSLNSLGTSLLPLFQKLGFVNTWTMLLLNTSVNG